MLGDTTNLSNVSNLVDLPEAINIASTNWVTIIGVLLSSGVVALVIEVLVHRREGKLQLKEQLEDFLSRWKDYKGGIKSKTILQTKMAKIGNELERVIKDIKKPLLPFPKNKLDEARVIADEIILLSRMGLAVTVGPNELSDLTDKQNQKKIEAGDKIAERAKELIKKL
ncbi:MAG: hypothetical protein GQ523_09020 [Methanophagales archaeon]|nr:hypothetical protein [Methanophagales archaeon]